jgi:hypothetical protein
MDYCYQREVALVVVSCGAIVPGASTGGVVRQPPRTFE